MQPRISIKLEALAIMLDTRQWVKIEASLEYHLYLKEWVELNKN